MFGKLKGGDKFTAATEVQSGTPVVSDEKVGGHEENVTALNGVNSNEPKKTELVCGDLNNVANLGFANAAELEKQVVKRLDTFMLPQ